MKTTQAHAVGRALAVAALWAVLAAALLASPARDSNAQDWQPRADLLVTSAWLARHLGDDGLLVVDVRDAGDYAAGHIPGAVNLPAGMLFATVRGVEGMLPPPERMAELLGAVGIGAATDVVAYDDAGGMYAARLFWALDYLGQGHGRLLDGGWPHWQREGRPASRDPVPVAAQPFTPRPRAEALADLAWMRAHLDDPQVLSVDARSAGEYRGLVRYAAHGGHIPGAVSMDWQRHLREDGTFRSPTELRAEYEALGVNPQREVAVYCQVHVRAAHSYFTLKWLGLPRVRGYDGSWAEWGNRDDTPKARF